MSSLGSWRIVAVLVALLVSGLVWLCTGNFMHFAFIFCALALTSVFMVPFIYSIFDAVYNENLDKHKHRGTKPKNQVNTVVVVNN